jgi:hypothetical protein
LCRHFARVNKAATTAISQPAVEPPPLNPVMGVIEIAILQRRTTFFVGGRTPEVTRGGLVHRLNLERLLRMRFFRFLLGQSAAPAPPQQLLLLDTFADDRNGWVDPTNRNPVLRQEIEQGTLCLDSCSPEMGVASFIASSLNGTRDFTIEASIKVGGKGDLAYACLNFGIAQLTAGLRTIADVEVGTDLGATKYYFGYSEYQEVLVAKWHKGVETFYYRGYNNAVEVGEFNKLTITKQQGRVSYAINGEIVFWHKARPLPGTGVGFSVAPNATLWVKYIQVLN